MLSVDLWNTIRLNSTLTKNNPITIQDNPAKMQNSQTPTNKYDVYNVNRYVPLVDFKVNLFDPDLGEIRSYDFGELYNMFDKKLPSVPKEKPSQEKKPEKVLPEDRYRGLRFN